MLKRPVVDTEQDKDVHHEYAVLSDITALRAHKDLAYEVLWSVVRMLTQRLRETNDKLTFLSVTGKFE